MEPNVSYRIRLLFFTQRTETIICLLAHSCIQEKLNVFSIFIIY